MTIFDKNITLHDFLLSVGFRVDTPQLVKYDKEIKVQPRLDIITPCPILLFRLNPEDIKLANKE